MKLQEDVQPLSELEEGTAQLIRTVAAEHRALVFTDQGGARAVLMDAESYESWRNSVALLRLVAQSEEDVKAGRLVPQHEAFPRAERVIKEATRGE